MEGTSSSHVEKRVDSLVNSIAVSIKPMSDNVPPLSPGNCIYRVPGRLRSVKPEAYTPHIVSIGPFHHGDYRLQTMEHLKTQYLHSLLHQHPEISLDRYVEELLELETRARNCYAETIPYTKEEFVKMLLLDGCFLLELFRQYCYPSTQKNNQLFTNYWIFNAIHRDVLLLENQIPFFVLETLFYVLTPTRPREIHGVHHLIQSFIGRHKLLGHREWHICGLREETLLLSVLKSITAFESNMEKTTPKSQTTIVAKLLRVCCPFKKKILRVCSPFQKIILRVCCPFQKKNPTSLLPIPNPTRLLPIPKKNPTSLLPIQNENPTSLQSIPKKNPTSLTFIPSAAELSAVGITFVDSCKDSESTNLFYVRFDQEGVFSIPSLVVNDRTESFLRNLIALEQTSSKTRISSIKDQIKSQSNKVPTISAYVTLMDCLVNTSADVALLREQGILINQLGDDAEVAQLFNKLRIGMIMNPYGNCFSEVFKSVNDYYQTKWNLWWAMFIREFWSTPWKRTSLLAAIFLLLFTFMQTLCSLLQV